MDICPACNMPYRSSASKFCSHCGMPRTKKVICEQCGAELEPDVSYCDSCGTRTAFGRKLAETLGE